MTVGWDHTIETAVALRRALHRRPELTWAEVATAATIRSELDRAGIPYRVCAETGTVATLAGDAPGRHVALRADIDAMPIDEATGVEWTSEHAGAMHACGHDGHTATLVATAWLLKEHETQLPGPVSLLFQPAEEGGHGAKRMIEDGALDGVDAIFGWHNWPAIPYGQAVCPDGPVMSANGTFRIEVTGEGGHASQPEACRDPVLAAAAITMALQQVVSRRLAPQQAAVVSVSSIVAPSADTVTPDKAVLGGSIRVADTVVREQVFDLIEQVAHDTAVAYGVTAITQRTPRYGATVNHPAGAAELRTVLADELGPDWHATSVAVPVMASEDFSYYLEVVPGAFALVGADDGLGHHEPCHSPRFDFNDRLIPTLARVFLRLAGAPLPDGAPPPDGAPVPARESPDRVGPSDPTT
jgi:amidohydrolase